MQPTKVISSEYIVDAGGNTVIICQMDDSSTWQCDLLGGSWKKLKPSDKFLTEQFLNAEKVDPTPTPEPTIAGVKAPVEETGPVDPVVESLDNLERTLNSDEVTQ